MDILKTRSDLNAWRDAQAGIVAFVPTMGALHDGHLALVKEAQAQAGSVIVSIFVNPTQFAPHEDLDSYPRALEEDCKKLEALGCHAVWAPSVEDVYPGGAVGADTEPGAVAKPLEGEFRPHFFAGVTTVVKRLFEAVRPDIAVFGEKDYQQLLVIRQMVKDLNMPVDIVGTPIVRDDNGLALSSRNAYLNEAEYGTACHLNRVLFSMAEKIREGAEIEQTETAAIQELKQEGFNDVQYCTVRDAGTLLPARHGPLRVLAAVKIGKTRLIDNVAV